MNTRLSIVTLYDVLYRIKQKEKMVSQIHFVYHGVTEKIYIYIYVQKR